MNNIILERINSQIKTNKPVTPKKSPLIIEKKKYQPIFPEELKNMLEKENLPIEKPIEEVKQINFEWDIFSFVEFYFTIRNKLNSNQQKALDTLLDARNMIDRGCPCKRDVRKQRMEEYFKTFWEQNVKTDMILAIATLSGAKNIKFKSKNEIFLDLNF